VKHHLAIFVLIIFLNALDFWVVKNITGRFLIGFRWWNEYDEYGLEKVVFEMKYF